MSVTDEMLKSHEEKVKPCPIEGCKYHWISLDALFGHLYNNHRKNEIIKALLEALFLLKKVKI